MIGNTGSAPVLLPEALGGTVLLTSGPLGADAGAAITLPADTTVWLSA